MKKRFSEEQIVRILGEAAGHGVPTTARSSGNRWRNMAKTKLAVRPKFWGQSG